MKTSTGSADVDEARIRAIVTSAQLQATRVLRLEAHGVERMFEKPEIDAQIAIASSVRARFDSNGLPCVSFIAGVRILTPDLQSDDDKPAMLIEVSRMLVYSGISTDATQEELEAFGRTTVMFIAWPFLRQDAFDLSARIGMSPPVLLPLFRLQPPKSAAASSSAIRSKRVSKAGRDPKRAPPPAKAATKQRR